MTELKRIDALKIIKKEYSNAPVIIPLASTAREMYSLGKQENEFYLLGSMGIPLSVATGIALGLQNSKYKGHVVCIEGDGGLLMNAGALITASYLKLKNLVIFLLDNESFATTGGQPTQSTRISLSTLAQSLGYKTFPICFTARQLKNIIIKIKNEINGPYFIHTKINKVNLKVPLIYEDPSILKSEFKKYLLKISGTSRAPL